MANANQKASCGQELFGALFEKQKIRRKIVGNRANQENQILIPDWTYFHCLGATLNFNPRDQRPEQRADRERFSSRIFQAASGSVVPLLP